LPVSEPGSTSGCLPRHLAGEGYDSVFFSSQFEAFEALGEEARMLGFQAGVFPGENDVVGFKKANYVSYEDDVMLAPSERWLGAHKDRPFLAGYLTGATHHSCLPPSGRHGAISFSDDRAVDRYANSVRYEDFFLRALFEQYRALGLYENTLFVIVGDHGESFGEHSRYVHTDVPWEEGLRVPMIFHDPKGETFKAGTVQGPANQLDIVPSLLEALGLRVSRGFLPGTSVLHLPAGRAVMASCFDRLWCLTRIEAGEKLILHFGHLPDQLFDLLHDPGETVNLAAAQPEKVGRWRNDLLAWDERVSHLYGDSPPTVVNAAAPQTP
jgi:arylsulfatase A-like enzyme